MSKRHEQDRQVSPGGQGLSPPHDQVESGHTPLTRGRFTLGASRSSAGYQGAAGTEHTRSCARELGQRNPRSQRRGTQSDRTPTQVGEVTIQNKHV